MLSNKYQELIRERDYLKQKNSELQRNYEERIRINEVNDQIEKILGKRSFRGGIYGNIYQLNDYEERWKGTVFDTQRLAFETMKFATLDMVDKFKDGCYNNPFCPPDQDLKADLLGYCSMVIPSKKGPILQLVDPYGEFTVPPLKKMSFEEALEYSGRMVIVTANFNYFKKLPEPIGIRLLPFSLFEDLRIK